MIIWRLVLTIYFPLALRFVDDGAFTLDVVSLEDLAAFLLFDLTMDYFSFGFFLVLLLLQDSLLRGLELG